MLTISGAANIQDTHLINGASYGDWCGGTATQLAMQNGTTTDRRTLIQVANSLLPAGTITGFRMKFWTQSGFSVGVNVYAHRILAPNTWVEGTVNNTSQVGSPCWNWRAYNTAAWAGSAGCNTSGVDYEANASPPSVIPGANGIWATLVLPPSWVSDWRDGVMANNGMRFNTNQNESTTSFRSSDDATHPLYFEIDYTPPPPGGHIQSLLMRRK